MLVTARCRRGFSVLEVLVAAALSLGLGAIVATVITSSSSASRDAIARADAAEEIRSLNDLLTRYVQAGVRRPECLNPDSLRSGTPLPFASCIVPGPGGDVLESVAADKIVFYSYPEGVVSSTPRSPEKVTVETSRDASTGAVTLTVSAQAVTNGDLFYVGNDSSLYSPARVLRSVTLVSPTVAAFDSVCPPPAGTPASRDVFSFFDANASPTSDPSKVAVVVFDPRAKVSLTGETCPRLVSSPLYLAFPSQGFGR